MIPKADLAGIRKQLEETLGREPSDAEGRLLADVPKVFTDFAAAQETYGPVSILPTAVYFFGMRPEEEVLSISSEARPW